MSNSTINNSSTIKSLKFKSRKWDIDINRILIIIVIKPQDSWTSITNLHILFITGKCLHLNNIICACVCIALHLLEFISS